MKHCSFCGKSQKEVNALVTSEQSDACICDECVALSLAMCFKSMRKYKVPQDIKITINPPEPEIRFIPVPIEVERPFER